MQYRELTGGYLSFKKAYIYSFLAFCCGRNFRLVFNIFLFHVIDPDLPEMISDAIVEQTVEMMEGLVPIKKL